MIYHVILKPDEPYRVEFALTARGDAPARDFLDSLPERPRKKAAAWIALLAEKGPDLPRPHADAVSGPIRELRVSFARLEIRVLYFIHGRRVVLTERLRALWLSSQERPS
jgi:hypothetical protein